MVRCAGLPLKKRCKSNCVFVVTAIITLFGTMINVFRLAQSRYRPVYVGTPTRRIWVHLATASFREIRVTGIKERRRIRLWKRNVLKVYDALLGDCRGMMLILEYL